ncbi:MAG: hypothetical protein V7765_17070 [Oleispira sp.]
MFPHLFESWTERYEPKNEAEKVKNPTAVADGYLRDGRGFDLIRVRGWYTQEYFHKSDINQGSTTVRFLMPNGFWGVLTFLSRYLFIAGSRIKCKNSSVSYSETKLLKRA